MSTPTMKDEAPYYKHGYDEGFGGYWVQCVYCSDNHYIMARGLTKDDAVRTANQRRNEHEALLRSPVDERISYALGIIVQRGCFDGVAGPLLLKAIVEKLNSLDGAKEETK